MAEPRLYDPCMQGMEGGKGEGRRRLRRGEGLGKLSKSVLYCHTALLTDLHTQRRQTITAMLHSKNLCQELQQETVKLLS